MAVLSIAACIAAGIVAYNQQPHLTTKQLVGQWVIYFVIASFIVAGILGIVAGNGLGDAGITR